MKTFQCAQRGCEFEAASAPENCPVCNNPFILTDAEAPPVPVAADGNGDGEVPWAGHTKAELKAQLEECGITGWGWRTNKAGLIALLEAAEESDAS